MNSALTASRRMIILSTTRVSCVKITDCDWSRCHDGMMTSDIGPNQLRRLPWTLADIVVFRVEFVCSFLRTDIIFYDRRHPLEPETLPFASLPHPPPRRRRLLPGNNKATTNDPGPPLWPLPVPPSWEQEPLLLAMVPFPKSRTFSIHKPTHPRRRTNLRRRLKPDSNEHSLVQRTIPSIP